MHIEAHHVSIILTRLNISVRDPSGVNSNITSLHVKNYTIIVVIKRTDAIQAFSAALESSIAFVRIRMKVRLGIVLEDSAVYPIVRLDKIAGSFFGQIFRQYIAVDKYWKLRVRTMLVWYGPINLPE